MQDADGIVASKMGDTRPDYIHMEKEIKRTVDHMTYLQKRCPSAQNKTLYRATRLIFGKDPKPFKDRMAEFSIMLSVIVLFRPQNLFLVPPQYVDPHKELPTPLVNELTGRIITDNLHEFPLWQLEAKHTTILLPFCFGKASWFLVEVQLDVMPADIDDEREASAKVYTNFPTCVNNKGGHDQPIEDWILQYLEYASRNPHSPMRTVDWSNKKPLREIALQQLINLGPHGILAATAFVADKGSAIELMQSDQFYLQRNLVLVCVQMLEMVMEGYWTRPFFRFSDRFLSPVLPYRHSVASVQASR